MADRFLYDLVDSWTNGATTWTGIGLAVTDAGSAADSALIDIKRNGSREFRVLKGGQLETAIARLSSTAGITLAGTAHAFQIGASTGANLAASGSQVQARNAGAAARLDLNPLGGDAGFGANILLKNNLGVCADTVAGADNANIALAGGGAYTSSRGAYFAAYGKEHPTRPSQALITPGPGGTVEVFGTVNFLAGQLGFPAAQNPSADPNTLDDYEEGTFTPSVQGSGVAGTASYSIRYGNYTKMGDRVLFELAVYWTALTGTGNIRVAGLPFSSPRTSPCSLFASDLTYSGQVSAYVSSTFATLISSTSGAGSSGVSVDAAASMIVSGHYGV